MTGSILPACGTGKSYAIAQHYNLWYLMLGASCSLELSEMVLPEHRKPEETEEGKVSASSKDASSSSILTEFMRMIFDCLVQKK